MTIDVLNAVTGLVVLATALMAIAHYTSERLRKRLDRLNDKAEMLGEVVPRWRRKAPQSLLPALSGDANDILEWLEDLDNMPPVSMRPWKLITLLTLTAPLAAAGLLYLATVLIGEQTVINRQLLSVGVGQMFFDEPLCEMLIVILLCCGYLYVGIAHVVCVVHLWRRHRLLRGYEKQYRDHKSYSDAMVNEYIEN